MLSLFSGYHPGWPESTPTVELPDESTLRLRPLRISDGQAWSHWRLCDERWLKPVEPTTAASWEETHSLSGWTSMFRLLRQSSRAGAIVPLVIELDGAFVGQVTIGSITHGTLSEAWIGYWVASPFMGRGVATAACALGCDHAFRRIGLHRLTATYLPSNPASGAVLAHNGFVEEGFLRKNLHIDGRWQDHHFVSLLVDDYEDSAVERLIKSGRIRAWR